LVQGPQYSRSDVIIATPAPLAVPQPTHRQQNVQYIYGERKIQTTKDGLGPRVSRPYDTD